MKGIIYNIGMSTALLLALMSQAFAADAKTGYSPEMQSKIEETQKELKNFVDERAMVEKERIHGERYPIDDDFLKALEHIPQACGIALGFDRLVMLATGAQHIEQVIWTPVIDPAHD